MKTEISIQQNQLAYMGTFMVPVLELWGQGGILLKDIYDALSPFGISLSDMRSEAVTSDVSGQAIRVSLTNIGTYQFRFDRIESTFVNFSDQVLAEIPKYLAAGTSWLRKRSPQFKFGVHRFVYSGHGMLKEGGAAGRLELAARPIVGSGENLGTGAIYHWRVADKAWTLQLIVDRSTLIPGGVYLMFVLEVARDHVDFWELLGQGRKLFEDATASLDMIVLRGS